MSEQIVMRCTSCGRRWNPASVSSTWMPCPCGNSTYSGEVVFGDFPDGSKVAAEFEDTADRVEEGSS